MPLLNEALTARSGLERVFEARRQAAAGTPSPGDPDKPEASLFPAMLLRSARKAEIVPTVFPLKPALADGTAGNPLSVQPQESEGKEPRQPALDWREQTAPGLYGWGIGMTGSERTPDSAQTGRLELPTPTTPGLDVARPVPLLAPAHDGEDAAPLPSGPLSGNEARQPLPGAAASPARRLEIWNASTPAPAETPPGQSSWAGESGRAAPAERPGMSAAANQAARPLQQAPLAAGQPDSRVGVPTDTLNRGARPDATTSSAHLAGGRPDSRDGDRTDALNRQDQAAAKTSSAPNPAGTPAAGSGAAHTLRDAGAAAATGSGLSAKTAEKSSEPTADPVQQADHKNGAGATTTERFAATDTSGERAGAVKNSPHPGGGMAGEPAVAWPFGEGREAGAPILPPRQDSGGITVPHATSGDGAASKDIQAQVLDQVLTHGLGHRTGGDGPETLTLRLDPPHLGKVGVQIQRDGDRLIITFRAEAAEAEAALREGAKGLAEGILGQRPHWSNVEIRWERTESEGRHQRSSDGQPGERRERQPGQQGRQQR